MVSAGCGLAALSSWSTWASTRLSMRAGAHPPRIASLRSSAAQGIPVCARELRKGVRLGAVIYYQSLMNVLNAHQTIHLCPPGCVATSSATRAARALYTGSKTVLPS